MSAYLRWALNFHHFQQVKSSFCHKTINNNKIWRYTIDCEFRGFNPVNLRNNFQYSSCALPFLGGRGGLVLIPTYLPYNSYEFSLENLELDQPMIPWMIFHYLSAWCLTYMVRRRDHDHLIPLGVSHFLGLHNLTSNCLKRINTNWELLLRNTNLQSPVNTVCCIIYLLNIYH